MQISVDFQSENIHTDRNENRRTNKKKKRNNKLNSLENGMTDIGYTAHTAQHKA